MPPAAPQTISLHTMRDTGGTYRAVLGFGLDDVTLDDVTFDRVTAAAHTRAIFAAAAAAEYDAAILDQMGQIDEDAATGLVLALRKDRPPITWPTPLRLEPGVSATRRTPFLDILIDGRKVGQWTPDDARGHACSVLESLEAADLDSAYLHALRSCDVDDEKATFIVADLYRHRHEESSEEGTP